MNPYHYSKFSKYLSSNSISSHLVNFPVVAGGFALLAATGATQAVVGGAVGAAAAATPIFSTSFVGGATGLLGM